MRKILCPQDDSLESYFVAAILNAKKFNDYVLKPGDVFDLWVSKTPPPGSGYTDLKLFLASTWTTAP